MMECFSGVGWSGGVVVGGSVVVGFVGVGSSAVVVVAVRGCGAGVVVEGCGSARACGCVGVVVSVVSVCCGFFVWESDCFLLVFIFGGFGCLFFFCCFRCRVIALIFV